MDKEELIKEYNEINTTLKKLEEERKKLLETEEVKQYLEIEKTVKDKGLYFKRNNLKIKLDEIERQEKIDNCPKHIYVKTNHGFTWTVFSDDIEKEYYDLKCIKCGDETTISFDPDIINLSESMIEDYLSKRKGLYISTDYPANYKALHKLYYIIKDKYPEIEDKELIKIINNIYPDIENIKNIDELEEIFTSWDNYKQKVKKIGRK